MTAEQDARIVELYNDGAGVREIARELRIIPNTLYKRLSALERRGLIARRGNGGWSERRK